jgi:hypothetical protein
LKNTGIGNFSDGVFSIIILNAFLFVYFSLFLQIDHFNSKRKKKNQTQGYHLYAILA